MNEWAGAFGNDYTRRNPQDLIQMETLYKHLYGLSASELFLEFLGDLPRTISILEVGCGSGNNLMLLRDLGYRDVTGVDINPEACSIARSRGLGVLEVPANDLPFKHDCFDLVFTHGVLIHIPPEQLFEVMGEMYRCTKRFIWGLEYYADQHTAVEYQGRKGLMWKGDFRKMFLDRWAYTLQETKIKRLPYIGSGNVDMMYLLEVR